MMKRDDIQWLAETFADRSDMTFPGDIVASVLLGILSDEPVTEIIEDLQLNLFLDD